MPAVTWAHAFLLPQGALRVRWGSSCVATLSPDPTPVELVERASKDCAEKREPVLLVALPRGRRGLRFRCKVQVPCCFPGKSQKLRCQPQSCSGLLALCLAEAKHTSPGGSPGARLTVPLVKCKLI